MTSTGLLISSYTIIIQSVLQLEQQISAYQHINDNNFVNLHDVTNLGLYNKLILVTQKQVLEFYIIAIERKTLNGLVVPHTAFPKCITTTTKATINTTTRVHVTKAVIGTHQELK